MRSVPRSVVVSAALLFGIMFGYAILETARDALFLAELGPHLLAAAYLTIAVVALVAVAAVRTWTRTRDPRRMLLAFLSLAVVGTALLAVLIPSASPFVFVLYVWTGLVATLVMPSFWTLMDRTLRIDEAKRRFAAIGAGGVVGAMFGSALASVLGHILVPTRLVTAAALALAVTTLAAYAFAPVPLDDEPPAPQRAEALSRGSRRYVELLIVVGAISTITLTLVDLTFKRVLAERFAAADLATVFGTIYTVLNFVGLVIQLAVTPALLARWGVGSALAVLPVLLVLTATGFVLTGALVAVIALKLSDGGLRYSLHRVASEILYMPMPANVRDRWKPVADAISQRGGQAIAALLTFGIASVASGSRWLGLAIAVTGVGWLFSIRYAQRAYSSQMQARG